MDASTAPQADLTMTDEALIAAEDAPSTTVEALMTDTANPDALEPHSKSVANNHIKSSQPMSSYQTAPETHDQDADMVDAAEEDDTPDGGVKLPAESTEASMNGDASDKRPYAMPSLRLPPRVHTNTLPRQLHPRHKAHPLHLRPRPPPLH